MQDILVTCYESPDLDGVASVFGYAELLSSQSQKPSIGIFGTPQDEALYVLQRFNIAMPKLGENPASFSTVVLLDASDLQGLPSGIPIENIRQVLDHRQVHDAEKFSNAKIQIELVGAAATLVTEKCMQAKLQLSIPTATLLYGAILSNTLNFRSSNTTPRDVAAAAWLQSIAKAPPNFSEELFAAKSNVTGSKLRAKVESDFATFAFSKGTVGIGQLEIFGVEEVITTRTNELKDVLESTEIENLSYTFINFVDLKKPASILFTGDEKTQQLLTSVFHVQFQNSFAVLNDVLLRKQIVPHLKRALD